MTEFASTEARWDEATSWLNLAASAAAEGRLDDGLAHARRAARRLAAVVGVAHPDHANAELTIGRILHAQERGRAALPHLERAVASLARRRRCSELAELEVEASLALALCLQELGQLDEGRRLARGALQIARRWLGPRAAQTAAAHNLLGVIGKFSGRFAEATRHYRAALRATTRRHGAVSREVATILHNLGGLEHARGEFRRGEPLARRSVEIARALLRPSDPERLAHEVAHAALLDGLGRQAESVPIYRRALAGFTRRYGRLHYEVASTLHNLATAEHALGRRAAARRHFDVAIELLAKLRGADHPDLALSRYNLALLHREVGELAPARALLVRALATFRARLGAKHPHTRACAEALAAVGRTPGGGARRSSRSRRARSRTL